IDLHTHTFYSDGGDDPVSVITNLKLKGTDIAALTDHDHMIAYFKGREVAKSWNLKLIPGVEVSTSKYHILGLNVRPEDQAFQDFLAYSRSEQKDRCMKRVALLNQYGVPITPKKVEEMFPESRLGKYNILMAMVCDPECIAYLAEHDPGQTPTQIFKFYLGKNAIASVKGAKSAITPAIAIAEIHKAGGIAIIAHPFKEVKDMAEMDQLVKEGIDGLEIQPNFGDANIPFREYALKNGLMMTYGSDFHGAAGTRTLLGKMQTEENAIEESVLEKMLNKWR
ncbi:MAG: PHP domain-containing protein, partial [archaeon]